MILYQDSLLSLDYDASTDIMYVQWPNLTDADLPDLQTAIKALIDTIKHYDIKKLLIDSRVSRVDIPDEIYRPLIFSLIGQLKESRIQRMARVMPENTYREVHLQSYTQQMQAANMFTYAIAEFESKEKAFAWLNS